MSTGDPGVRVPAHKYVPANVGLWVPAHKYLPADVGVWLPAHKYVPAHTLALPHNVSQHRAAAMPSDYNPASNVGLPGPTGRRRSAAYAGHGDASPGTRAYPADANLPHYSYKPAVPHHRHSLHTYSGMAVPYEV
ncbi:MAG TPA: hypothetical protein VFH60_08100 [Chloroflexia bacterium]|nr:hypothetical protein [Chloroflexia bacterium]